MWTKWIGDCWSFAITSLMHAISRRGKVKPRIGHLSVLYQSSNYIVVNKCPDIPVNTDTPDVHPLTVEDQLRYAFPHLVDENLSNGFRFCHRLDYSTSGVLCIALNKKAAGLATKAFESRQTEKYYLAFVHGHVEQDFLVINKGIGEDTRPHFTHKMCSEDKSYCSNPRIAITCLYVIERGLYNNLPATKVLLKPITGRRHQLRVHCFEVGHTIVGDYTYSDHDDALPHRMFLHSYRLVLPTKLELLDVQTSDPFMEKDKENKWRSLCTVLPLDSHIFEKVDSLSNTVREIYIASMIQKRLSDAQDYEMSKDMAVNKMD